jgi:hypothetical protein
MESAAVNRLTKNIALVFISSSIVLAGCGQEEQREDFAGGPFDSGRPRDSAYDSSGHGQLPSHFYYHNGTYYYGAGGGAGPGKSPSNNFGSPGGSSYAGSTRGGFGASAHGAGG